MGLFSYITNAIIDASYNLQTSAGKAAERRETQAALEGILAEAPEGSVAHRAYGKAVEEALQTFQSGIGVNPRRVLRTVHREMDEARNIVGSLGGAR